METRWFDTQAGIDAAGPKQGLGDYRRIGAWPCARADSSLLTVDRGGNLWIAAENNAVAELTPAQMTAGGTTAPAIAVTIASADPSGLAFDAPGNLWVADAGWSSSPVNFRLEARKRPRRA